METHLIPAKLKENAGTLHENASSPRTNKIPAESTSGIDEHIPKFVREYQKHEHAEEAAEDVQEFAPSQTSKLEVEDEIYLNKRRQV